MLLEPFLGAEDGMWVAVNLMPAVFGAFMVVPVAMMAKDEIGPAGGVVAAWLIAFMPAHITKSIWSLADHDAFVLLFLMLGFAFWMRAMRHAGSDRLVRSVSLNPRKFSNAVGAVVRERPYAFANAVLRVWPSASQVWHGRDSCTDLPCCSSCTLCRSSSTSSGAGTARRSRRSSSP